VDSTDFKRYEPCESLLLRVLLGLTLIFWGYEKWTEPKLAQSDSKDYGPFMLMDVGTFLSIFGLLQIVLGIDLILGLYTRLSAALLMFLILPMPLQPWVEPLRF